jgi:hypothetical protein
MNAADIQVLERADGYLRLRLPVGLRNREAGAALEAALKTLAGVQRLTLLTAEGRLAVRFDPRAATHASVALRIKDTLAGLPQPEPAAEEAGATVAEAAPAGESLAARLDDVRGKLIAATPERFRPMVESATTEKAVTNFLNDIVAFYLIRVHWDLIVNRWIKEPAKYGNAWMTVFYLVYLLVRYRKS